MPGILERSVKSTAWNIGVSFFGAVVLFARSVLLSRWLPVTTFGVYIKASAIVTLAAVVMNFGLTAAFLHRSPETEDEEKAAATHFTLICLFAGGWLLAMWLGSLLFASGPLRWAWQVLAAAMAVTQLTQTSRAILLRRIVHRRLALIQILVILGTTAAALGLAWQGVTLNALLATNVVSALITIVMHYLWRPVWRPRFRWKPSEIRYFLNFGSRTFLSSALIILLDRIDDLWTGFYLGETALGFYGRAYTFATYPRRILATPINAVTGGTYAELKYEKQRLSQAFFRTLAFLVRTGFLLGGILVLIAPEFVKLLLGPKWLPIINIFRLMLIFTLLDPIKGTVSNLFIAVGKPEEIIRARLIQLAILLAGMTILGHQWGIIGIALAVDIMLLAGIAILLWKARAYVTISIQQLFSKPVIALILALLAGYGSLLALQMSETTILSALVKSSAFLLVYTVLLYLFEREQMQDILTMLRSSFLKQKRSTA